MTISEMLDKVQYATDDKGNELVLIDRAAWEELLEILEDLEDVAEIERVRKEGDYIPWEQAVEELRAQGIDVV